MDPVFFGYYVFPIKNARLILYLKKPFLENDLKSPLFFLRENKIRKKTLNMTHDKKM